MNSKNNSVFKSAFKQTTKISYIQMQGIQKKKIDPNEKKKEEEIVEKDIEQNVDDKSMRLKKFFEAPSALIIYKKTGQLYTQKQSSSWFGCFSAKRNPSIVQLINRKLYIKNSHRLKGFINFDAVSVDYKQKDNSITFQIQGRLNQIPTQQFYLQSLPHAEDISQWQNLIKQAMKTSQGVKNKLNYVTTLSQYWKNEYILQKQFAAICNSGDIILFRSDHIMAQVQRGGTNSEYDHVGILLKNQKNQIVIFQSNSNTGVAFTFWKDLMRFKWYENVQRIAYRKLQVQRNQRMINMMEEFIVNNLDKSFDIGLGKILTFKSSLQKTVQQQKNRTYFCSQLVAAFYKHIGLLQKQKSSTQYWPKDFSGNGSLPLLKGSLGPEQVICFETKVYGNQYD